MKLIELTKGYYAQVDDEDFHWLIQYKWRVSIGSANGDKPYTVRTGKKSEGILYKKNIRMHRQIMDTPHHLICEHSDSDGLNNQRDNLENTTTKENNLRNIAFALNMRWGKGPRR